MLFSILIGAIATLYFLGRAAILKAKLLFGAKKDGVALTDNNFKQYVVYNEGMQYWNLFKPVCDEFEKRQLELTYYTSAEKDPVFEQGYKYVKSEFIGEGNKAFVRLNMLSAGVVLMTTPGLNVYQLKRSKRVKHYAHVVHATGDATLYRLFGVDYFDSVLLTGDYQAADIRTLEEQRGLPAKELVSVGCPYLDILQEKIAAVSSEENHPFTVLVSPSWGAAALLSRYGEKLLDPLVDTGWRIIIRPHPQSKKSEAELLTRLESQYKDKANVEWDYERDNIYAMKKSDIMISDFSGIIFDYTFLCDKPVMYSVGQIDLRAYDAYDINQGKDLWQFKMLEKMGIALEESDFGRIRQVIESVKDNPQLAAARKEAKDAAWMHQGNAGKEIVNFMVKKASTL
ncbi:MAG: CDP-glycerol glycerophosphotransferase family protein [Treponema sp.]|nr:CDP-glycerol glycerophosphotransferase family protein [Treponema sp.]